jgi:hypothetical protein
MDNIVIENVQIYGSGNNCAGIEIIGASDNKTGVKIKNVYVRNGTLSISGVNNDIQDVQIEIDSTSFEGPSAGARLFRVGIAGVGGYQHVENLFINASNISASFLSAARAELGILIGDNANWKNIRIKVPDGLSQSYPHCEFWGSDWNLDGYTYDGPGYTFVGTSIASVQWAIKNAVRLGSGASASAFLYTNASVQWAIKNAVRLGSGASASEFLYTNNAGTGNGLFENITDFRPTTAPTINIVNGLGAGNRFLVTNVASKTSNGTIAQTGGLATVVNAIKFP